jgi:hypothetical protein
MVLECRDAGNDRLHLIKAPGVSLPREPPPIKPNRIRSFAPRTRLSLATPVPAAATPAAPLIIEPMKTRRLDMDGISCALSALKLLLVEDRVVVRCDWMELSEISPEHSVVYKRSEAGE